MKDIRRVLRLLSRFSGEILLSLLLGIAAISAGIGLLGTSAYLIASAALHPSIAELQVAIVGVRFFGLSRGVFRYLERLVSHSVNLRFLSLIREDFYRRVEPGAPQNLATYRSGDLLQRVMGDLEVLENFYVRVLAPFIIALVITAGVSIFVGGYLLELGLILAVGLLATGFLQPWITSLLMKPVAPRLLKSRSAASSLSIEYLQGLEDLEASNSQGKWSQSLRAEFSRSGEIEYKISLVNGWGSGFYLLLSNLTLLLLLWVAIPAVTGGELGGVSLAVVTLVSLASFEGVAALPAAANHFNNALASSERLFSLGANPIKEADLDWNTNNSGQSTIEVNRMDLVMDGEDELLLEDLSFSLIEGQKIALIGASGTGKTSLVNCLLGYLAPQRGSIRVNEVDVDHWQLDELRSKFAVLPQAIYLFNDTVRNNLLLADPCAEDDQLIAVLNKSALQEWYSALPHGLDSWVGEHGVKMSGGERQRLAIARLMLQTRPFVIMDEPTSQLDDQTAGNVMKNLLTHFAKSGMLLITHRFDILDQMDEILVLSGTGIAERGSFSELMERGGILKKLYDLERDWLSEY